MFHRPHYRSFDQVNQIIMQSQSIQENTTRAILRAFPRVKPANRKASRRRLGDIMAACVACTFIGLAFGAMLALA